MISVRKGYLHLALESLRNSRARSFMTMLGIVISVMAVVVIVGIGQGVKEQVGNQVSRYGSDVLVVRPNQSVSALTGSGLPGGTSALLSASDATTIRGVNGVGAVVPMSVVSGTAQGDHTATNPLVIATTPELAQILNQKIDYGGFFDAADGEQVAVLGTSAARKLFDDNAPLGQQLTFRGQQFLIAGVFKPFTAAPFSLEANYNEAIFIPYQAAQTVLKTEPAINQIFVKAKPGVDIKTLTKNVQAALNAAHGGSSDTVVLLPGAGAAGSNQTLQLLTFMTIAIAIVALIVGGVGIMNMMFVSVTERIHEIGLRKAIGATNRQILRQFITEAVALCGVGAFIGFIGSLVAIGLLRLYSSLQPVVIWPVALLVPLAALAVGVFFGTIPALKASRMDPIEALRHE